MILHLRYTGDMTPYDVRTQRKKSAEQRFWEKVARTETCWLWTAATDTGGYGTFAIVRGRAQGAHRIAYEWLVGPIPDGMHLDRLCRVRHCVNPAHLEVVTNGENVRRGVGPFATNLRKTHCVRGHAFDEANTRIDRRGYRQCRACGREKWHRRSKS